MKASDISVRDLLRALADRSIPVDVQAFPGVPSKVVHAKLAKLDRRGLIEWGVSIRTAWLTDAGKAELARLEGES